MKGMDAPDALRAAGQAPGWWQAWVKVLGEGEGSFGRNSDLDEGSDKGE